MIGSNGFLAIHTQVISSTSNQPSVLQACNRSPSQVNSEKNAARTLQQQEDDLQKLRDRVSVLAHAKDTDGRRFRQIAVERQREREDLKREVERLKVGHCDIAAARSNPHCCDIMLTL